MSLVRVPRLWTRRYSYPSWRALPDNVNLEERDAIELFKHEERRWSAFEDESRNQYANRQATLVDQINQLDSYIFGTLNIESGGGSANIQTVSFYPKSSAFIELITDAGIVLVTNEGLFLTPDHPSTTRI
jgi:hypothetical protein|tara:strand:- start:1544 stop:1933 length:390 start_codon:yes stop_codon:yes gene_type:complete